MKTPLYGVTGIAVTNVISRGLAFLLIAVCLWRSNLNLQFSKKNLKTLKCIGSILHIGLPGGISSMSYSVSQVVTTSILAILGTTAISDKRSICPVYFFYIYVVGMSLGSATSLIIGWLVGAEEYDKAYRLNLQNLRIAVLLNLIGSTPDLHFSADRCCTCSPTTRPFLPWLRPSSSWTSSWKSAVPSTTSRTTPCAVPVM